jgi:DoxX-like protein
MESISAVQLWAGRVMSALAVLFLFVDAIGKLLRVGPVVEGTVKLGYQENVVFPLGVLLLIGVVLYAMPRTSLLGAIYLTAFLGGAVATHVRVGSPLATHVLFGVYVAVFLWCGLALRSPRLLTLLTGVH